MTSPTAHITYFGMWSARKVKLAIELLNSHGVRYEVNEDEVEDQKRLEDWCAWDPDAENPHLAFDLWIFSADLPKLGTKLIDAFPERTFEV